ncbi:MAG: hypothetical protein MUO73_07745 [Thermoplasmata archaeon]|jgi:hypothetical protein|nr:hypothetical protein [Thermoplasmata archaeon]
MVSLTLKITNDFKALIDKLTWINWSELARDEVQKKLEEERSLETFKKIIAKSRLTQEDADRLSENVKQSMHQSLKRKGLI